jgi:hypothetical protein
MISILQKQQQYFKKAIFRQFFGKKIFLKSQHRSLVTSSFLARGSEAANYYDTFSREMHLQKA